MPRAVFTSNLTRHVSCPTGNFDGTSVREVLDSIFLKHSALKGYILDEQGRLRQHVVIFVDGHPIRDRIRLTDAVPETGEVYVMQALSGG